MQARRIQLRKGSDLSPIPALSGRQFVIAPRRSSTSEEWRRREAFWLREQLLESLKISWREVGTGRKGRLSLRRLRFSSKMLDALKVEPFDLEVSLANLGESPISSGPASFQLYSNRFSQAQVVIRNNTSAPYFFLPASVSG